ncbi:hypothetical protein TREMEDRAFT_26128 [Tremella mesenterica DSM 1558]|uniref:uncharacterized protein n=1 Tax=Tremella mesenterica (strain ATCC 24925 / CBS 8224 / DSM 1558 / NBRC 9311 / NRRL Y-6157 / RJB 2259-6 / UBC 559-6) TaxID=578456 RepID=UPI0003F48F44|nr:uncharacterized protein TREMEDRAFT_26128 [Tremella mesenterica DSM 1558]EIW72338.1 hypothetical protein TREMEDRAFT_26128 [Tremella mesenterica DSM 1558]
MVSTNGETPKSVVLITGSAGWLGNILAGELLSDPKTPNVHLILCDIVLPKAPKNAKHCICLEADLSDKAQVEDLFKTEYGVPDTIYCFHGIMSRGSEDNFDLGLKINIDSIRLMLDAARHAPRLNDQLIKFIFSSALGVYGGPTPPIVTPATMATPEGAYGTGKLISELLVNEYTRRGFVDGRSLRLPTIVVRPGVPSAATSAFISGIIREPLHGQEAVCPIGSDVNSPELELQTWVASPETTIKNFVIAKHIPAEKFLSHTRAVYLPGFTTTIKEELDALKEVAGEEALKLVKFKDDPINRRLVGSWPTHFDLSYPLSLGFVADEGGMVPIVKSFKAAVDAGLV